MPNFLPLFSPDRNMPLPYGLPRVLPCAAPAVPPSLAWPSGGILAAHCAQVRGDSTIVLIDNVQYRLDHAKAKIPGLHTINFDKEKASAGGQKCASARCCAQMCPWPLAAGQISILARTLECNAPWRARSSPCAYTRDDEHGIDWSCRTL